MERDHGLWKFFRPKTVAVIGAAREKGKVGYAIFRDLSRSFKGAVYPVNPYADEILGHKCYPKVTDIPDDIDMAVIVVPAKIVEQVLKDCGEKGIKHVVIISSGFSEIGEIEREKRIKEIANTYGIKVIGPNCLGVFDPESGVDTLFLPREKMMRPKKGGLSFISQSGAVGSVILDWAANEGLGCSKFISYGNALNLADPDFVDFLGKDPDTKVICMYLEGTKNGRKLMEVAKKVSREKPILCIKAGKTEAGSKAAASHTGSLAGSDMVYDAAFKQSGIIRVRDVQEMFDLAKALNYAPLPKGDQIAIVTNGGGFGVLTTDEVVQLGLKMAKFSEKTLRALEEILPPHVKPHNPLDLAGDADPERYSGALEVLLKDPNVHGIILILLFQTVSLEPDVFDKIKPLIGEKPIIACSAGSQYTQNVLEKFKKAHIPVYPTPARAAKAMWALVKYSKIRTKLQAP